MAYAAKLVRWSVLGISLLLASCELGNRKRAETAPTVPDAAAITTPDSKTKKPAVKVAEFKSNHPFTPRMAETAQRAMSEAGLETSAAKPAKARAIAEFLARTINLRPAEIPIPTWTFLFDDSKSMTIRDEADGRSRWEAAMKEWDVLVPRLKTWSDRGQLIFQTKSFSDAERGLRPWDRNLHPSGESTDIGDALGPVGTRPRETLGNVVVFSDGAETGFGRTAADAAHSRRREGKQIFTIALGQDELQHDVAVLGIDRPEVCEPGHQITVSARVFAKNLDLPESSIELLGKLATNEGEPQLLASFPKAVLRDANAAQKIEFPEVYAPTAPGDWLLTVRIREQPKEATGLNNQETSLVRVRPRLGRTVLLLSGPESAEAAALQKSLENDSVLSIHNVVLASTDPADIDQWSQVVTKELEGLDFDVVIVCDIHHSWIPDALQQKFQGLLGMGKGILYCGGKAAFEVSTEGQTQLAKILPIDFSNESRREEGVQFVATNEGLDNAILRIAANPEASRKAWAALKLSSAAWQIGRAKGDAKVLVEAESNQMPLVAVQNVFRGRTGIWLAETSNWIAADAPDEHRRVHQRVWKQILLWLARYEPPEFVLTTRLEPSGTRSMVYVTVRPGEQPLDLNQTVTCTLESPAGMKQSLTLRLDLEKQAFEGNLALDGLTGTYRVHVQIQDSGQIRFDAAESIVNLPQPDREFRRIESQRSVLADVSAMTGAKMFKPGEMAELLGIIEQDLAPPRFETASDLESLVCDHRAGSSEDFAKALASLLQSQAVSSRIVRDPKTELWLVEIPLVESELEAQADRGQIADRKSTLQLDPATGREPVQIERRTFYLVVDVGPVMSASKEGRTALETAQEKLSQFIVASPVGSEFRGLTNGGAIPGASMNAEQAQEWIRRLAIDPGARSMRRAFEAALQWELAEASDQPVSILVCSDRQSHMWNPDGGDQRVERLLEEVRKQPGMKLDLCLLDFGIDSIQNERINGVRMQEESGELQLIADIEFPEHIDDLNLIASTDGPDTEQRRVMLTPEVKQPRLTLLTPAGLLQGRLYFSRSDALALDDVFYWTKNVGVATEVHVVLDGNDDQLFWVTALRTLESGSPIVHCRICTAELIEQETLDKTSVVYLLGVNQPSETLWKQLQGFVRNGGGLVVLPGSEFDAKSYRVQTALDLLGCELKEMREVADPLSFDLTLDPAGHALQKALAGAAIPHNILKYWNLGEVPKDQVVVRFTNGSPAIITRRIEKGSAWLVATDLTAGIRRGRETGNNILLTPFAIPLVAELTQHAGIQIETRTQFVVGEPVVLPGLADGLYPLRSTSNPEFQTVEVGVQKGTLKIEKALFPGNYLLQSLIPVTETEKPLGFSVNLDPKSTQRGGKDLEQSLQTLFSPNRILDGNTTEPGDLFEFSPTR